MENDTLIGACDAIIASLSHIDRAEMTATEQQIGNILVRSGVACWRKYYSGDGEGPVEYYLERK